MTLFKHCEKKDQFFDCLEKLFYNSPLKKNSIRIKALNKLKTFDPHFFLLDKNFLLSKKTKIDQKTIEKHLITSCRKLVFVDGFIDLNLTNIEVEKETKEDRANCFFNLFNQVFNTDEIHLNIKDSTPIQIIHVFTKSATNALISPKINITIEKNKSCEIISTICNFSSYCYHNLNISIFLKENSKLIFNENLQANALFCNIVKAELLQNSFLKINSLHKTNILKAIYTISLNKHANFQLNQLCDLEKNNKNYLDILVLHKQPFSYSNVKVKSILKDCSIFDFKAQATVYKKASEAKCFQKNENLKLSNSAICFSKPFLQIFADDAKAFHGATMHNFDKEELFYLQSRGLSKTIAKKLLIKGFGKEITTFMQKYV